MDFIKQEREKLKELETLLIEKRVSEAEIKVRELAEEFPFSFQVKLLSARVFKEAERLDDAFSILSGLLAEDSNNISVLNEIGDVCFRMQKYDEAKEYYNRLMFLDPFNPNAKAAIDMVERIGSDIDFTSPEPAAEPPAPVFQNEPEDTGEEREYDSVSAFRDDFFGGNDPAAAVAPEADSSAPETAYFPGEWDLSDPGTPPPVPAETEEPVIADEKLLEKLEDTVVEMNPGDIGAEQSGGISFDEVPVMDRANKYDFDAPPQTEAPTDSPVAEFDNYEMEESREEPVVTSFESEEPPVNEISFDDSGVMPAVAEEEESEDSSIEVINPFADTEAGFGSSSSEEISFGDVASVADGPEEPEAKPEVDLYGQTTPDFDSFDIGGFTPPPAPEITGEPVKETEELNFGDVAPPEAVSETETPSFEAFDSMDEESATPVFSETPEEVVVDAPPAFETFEPVETSLGSEDAAPAVEPDMPPQFDAFEAVEEEEPSPVFGDTGNEVEISSSSEEEVTFGAPPEASDVIEPESVTFSGTEDISEISSIDYSGKSGEQEIEEISFADSGFQEDTPVVADPFVAETVVEAEEDKLAEEEEVVSAFEVPEEEASVTEEPEVIESSGVESTDINFDLNETPDILSGLHDVNNAVAGGAELEYFNEAPAEKETKETPEFDEPEIITESAAALYLKQGLYDDAREVYEKLLLSTGDDKFRLEIEKIKKVERLTKEIEALEKVLEVIVKAGEGTNV